jgi:threonyl-tRNA synthetase
MSDSKKAKNKDKPVEVESEYLQWRIDLFDKLKAEVVIPSSKAIVVTLPNGNTIHAESFKTTPLEIAGNISSSLKKSALIAKVNGILFDLERPLEEDCKIQFLDWDNDEAKTVFWHSSAHILGIRIIAKNLRSR